MVGCTVFLILAGILSASAAGSVVDGPGDTIWTRRYSGAGSWSDAATAIAVDASGNVYVTGRSYNSPTLLDDYVTIKYTASGATVWTARYDGNCPVSGQRNDQATAIALDASGYVYVTGSSFSNVSGHVNEDYLTIKYNPANGETVWTRRYTGPGNNGTDIPCALAVKGNCLYVTGQSWGDSVDYATVKYDLNGQLQWERRYDGGVLSNNYDAARGLAVDDSGNVYVTGFSTVTESYPCDYVTIRYDANGYQRWLEVYDGPANYHDKATAIAVDRSGRSVYVTGHSWFLNEDYLTIRYDAQTGSERWTRRYDGTGNANDEPLAIAASPDGGACVTGFSPGDTSGNDYLTIKYDSDGNQSWIARYNGPANRSDQASAIAVGADGGVAVTGESDDTANLGDYATVRYDAAGNQQWVARFDDPSHNRDHATAVAIDGAGHVYITGSAFFSPSLEDYLTIKYDDSPLHDIGVMSIIAPLGVVDSGATVTPQAWLRNYGDSNEVFTARMTVGTSYADTASIALGAEDSVLHSFAPVALSNRGALAVKCSTRLATDGNLANNQKTDSVFVRVLDAEADSILGPAGTVDSGSTITPRANIRNRGNTSVTFIARFDIGSWSDTQNETLAAGATRADSFAHWTASQRGPLTVRCTTLLAGDMVPANNFKTSTVAVAVHDVGAKAIIAPTGLIPPGPVFPQARVHNYGTARESMTVAFTINSPTPYSQTVGLPNGLPLAQDTIIKFTSWTATTGSFTAKCSTYLATDQISANNVVSSPFTVGAVDVGVTTILTPTGSNDTSAALTPSAKVKNLGAFSATFKAFFRLDNGLDPVIYVESVSIANLSVGSESTVTFSVWPKPHAAGNYATRCSTYLAGDANHVNDTSGGSFRITVLPSETGWVRKADAPVGPKNKRVKDGGVLACSNSSDLSDGSDASYIYALKGNNTCEFYRYNIATNTWEAKESIPAVGISGKKKCVKKGSALTKMGGKIYGIKGNNSLEFWSYNPSYRSYPSYSWTQLADVPAGTKKIKEGAGAVAVEVGGASYIYFLKGSGTQELYRYDITTNTWEARENAPLGASGKTWKNGSCIAYDGDSIIHAVKGSYNEFYAYNVRTNAWATLSPVPFVGRGGRKKKVKDGAGLAFLAGHIKCQMPNIKYQIGGTVGGELFALKGGNTYEFWCYSTASDSWTQRPDAPFGSGKKVKAGGALCASTEALYALKGNNTLEFYRYGLSAYSLQPTAHRPNEMSDFQLSTLSLKLSAAPNPFSNATTISYGLPTAGNVSLKLYDVTGQVVQTLANGYHPAGVSSIGLRVLGLPHGLYLLRLETETSASTSKLIVE
jgi:hypothetical protein